MGVAQDSLALRLVGVDPVRIKTLVFGLGIATASVAGALLIMISPVEPRSAAPTSAACSPSPCSAASAASAAR